MQKKKSRDEKIATPYDPMAFADNMSEATQLWQMVLQRLSVRNFALPSFGHTDPLHMGESFALMAMRSMRNPGQMVEQSMGMWKDYLNLWQNTTQRLLGHAAQPAILPDAKDRRFQDPAWSESTLFDFVKQSYLINSKYLAQAASSVEGLDAHTARKISFFLRQFVDALSPTNFMLTNPEVMRLTMETNGENLARGMRNMLQDIERGDGKLRISMSDDTAFELGTNIACTPGKVVFENELMQLIQYAPSTETVHEKPLLIIPAWINKYYILDLKPENSMVRWLVAQGYTVFMISWVNPDATLGRKSFDDYLMQGPLAALDAIEKATGQKEANVIGYCLGGTLLSILLAYLRARGQASRIPSATFLTTMIDFAESGDLSVFIDEGQLSTLEERMSEMGYLEGEDMATTFNMLRANDLIWSFVVNNYLLGKDPFPFDLLYWNSDSTRMPATMHSFYLRNMYQKNLLVKPGGIEVAGVPVNLSKIETPVYIMSTREDHIAPWQSTYAATQIYDGPVQFTLADSGHVAGVVNPPAKKKYGYSVNEKLPAKPAEWLEGASHAAGSWWPHWEKWQRAHAGPKIKARHPGRGKLRSIENAPGRYVRAPHGPADE